MWEALSRARDIGPQRTVALGAEGIPCRERVHVVPPVRDLALADVDDGAEAIVVGGAVRQDRAVDLVLDDDHAFAVCLVDDEMVGSVELDGLDVTAKLAHERGASAHDTRPSPEVVEDLVDGVLVHDVEEVLPVDEVTERASDEIEVGRSRPVRCVGMAGHGSSITGDARLENRARCYVLTFVARPSCSSRTKRPPGSFGTGSS